VQVPGLKVWNQMFQFLLEKPDQNWNWGRFPILLGTRTRVLQFFKNENFLKLKCKGLELELFFKN
jgi:hypothetical protein